MVTRRIKLWILYFVEIWNCAVSLTNFFSSKLISLQRAARLWAFRCGRPSSPKVQSADRWIRARLSKSNQKTVERSGRERADCRTSGLRPERSTLSIEHATVRPTKCRLQVDVCLRERLPSSAGDQLQREPEADRARKRSRQGWFRFLQSATGAGHLQGDLLPSSAQSVASRNGQDQHDKCDQFVDRSATRPEGPVRTCADLRDQRRDYGLQQRASARSGMIRSDSDLPFNTIVCTIQLLFLPADLGVQLSAQRDT